MAEVGVLAYPVVLATMVGVSRLGRDERWGRFEWLRFATLAMLFGLIVSVQVTMVMLGVVTSAIALTAALVSVAGAAFLLGLYLWDRWLQRAPRAAPAPHPSPA